MAEKPEDFDFAAYSKACRVFAETAGLSAFIGIAAPNNDDGLRLLQFGDGPVTDQQFAGLQHIAKGLMEWLEMSGTTVTMGDTLAEAKPGKVN